MFKNVSYLTNNRDLNGQRTWMLSRGPPIIFLGTTRDEQIEKPRRFFWKSRHVETKKKAMHYDNGFWILDYKSVIYGFWMTFMDSWMLDDIMIMIKMTFMDFGWFWRKSNQQWEASWIMTMGDQTMNQSHEQIQCEAPKIAFSWWT